MTQTLDPELITSYEDRIRTAYNRYTAPGEPALLTEIRPLVGGYDEYVDAALVQLSRRAGVSLWPESNQKVLVQADRDAAVWHGGQWKHLIVIG